MTRPQLHLIADGEIAEYPIPKGERLESHSFFLFHFDRYLHSNLFLLGDWDVQGVALALWSLARRQDPVGTLPSDTRIIAKLLKGMPIEQMEGLLRRDPSPLHGWRRCSVGGEIRLMHPTVTEVALAALSERTKAKDRGSAEAERKKAFRLREIVVGLGYKQFAESEMFLAQLTLAFEARYPGANRSAERVLRVMREDLGVSDTSRR